MNFQNLTTALPLKSLNCLEKFLGFNAIDRSIEMLRGPNSAPP